MLAPDGRQALRRPRLAPVRRRRARARAQGHRARRVELPPPLHAPIQRVLLRRAHGAGDALRRRREALGLAGDPARASTSSCPSRRCCPPTRTRAPRSRRAEEWGDEVFQPIARRLLWPALHRRPAALASYSRGREAARCPRRCCAPWRRVVTRVELRLNNADDGAVRADLRALPGHLDRVDGWIADGVLGGEPPNAADLQIAPTVRLLMTIGDVRPLIEGRPAARARPRALRRRRRARCPPGAYPRRLAARAGRRGRAACPSGA